MSEITLLKNNSRMNNLIRLHVWAMCCLKFFSSGFQLFESQEILFLSDIIKLSQIKTKIYKHLSHTSICRSSYNLVFFFFGLFLVLNT